MSFLYQRCYTNLLRYNGETRVGGWTAAAVSRDIPPSVQTMCEQFQGVNASEKNVTAMDITGRRPLRLYEYLCDGQYAYVIRTRYGLRDHGNRPNLFSHAYIAPLDGCALTQPEQLLSLDASCFEQDVSDAERNADPAAESKLLAERAEKRLNANGVLDKRPESNDPFDFQAALDADALRFSSDNKEQYRTLLECVYAQMNEQRETGTRLPPLYVEYAAAGDADASMRRLLCAILHALPYWMRRELKASNWCGIANTQKDLMFVTEGAKMLSSRNGGRYVILSSGETGLKGKYIGRAKRCGYLAYAVMKLTPGKFADFFDGLDRIAKALGDADASSEEIRKLVWQCYWNDASKGFTGMDAPNLDGLSEKDAARLLSDVTKSGAYSEALRELVDKVKEKAVTLTDALKSDLSTWEAECERQSRVQTQSIAPPVTPTLTVSAPPPVETTGSAPLPVTSATPATSPVTAPPTTMPPTVPSAAELFALMKQQQAMMERQQAFMEQQAQAQPQAVPQMQNLPPQSVAPTPSVESSVSGYNVTSTPDVTSTLDAQPLSVIDWEAADRDWRALPVSTQQKMSAQLEKILNKTDPLRGFNQAYSDFYSLITSATPQFRNIYLLLLIDRRVSGRIPFSNLMKSYCNNLLKNIHGASPEQQWKTLSIVCSLCERTTEPSLKSRIENAAWDLFRQDARPGGAIMGRAETALRNYAAVIERLYPRNEETQETRMQKARERYWEQDSDFRFDALSEYEAFDDGKPHFFLELARTPDKFIPTNCTQFLETTCRLFQLSGNFTPNEIRDYTGRLYTEINRRNGNALLVEYRSWLYMAGLAQNDEILTAIQGLYEAFPSFEPNNILLVYRALVRECKKANEREIRKVAYELVKNACCQSAERPPIPLDLWIYTGKEGFQTYKLLNCFAIFEHKPDAYVLKSENPADIAQTSELLKRQDVQTYAQAYIKERSNDRKIKEVVKQWLKEAERNR